MDEKEETTPELFNVEAAIDDFEKAKKNLVDKQKALVLLRKRIDDALAKLDPPPVEVANQPNGAHTVGPVQVVTKHAMLIRVIAGFVHSRGGKPKTRRELWEAIPHMSNVGGTLGVTQADFGNLDRFQALCSYAINNGFITPTLGITKKGKEYAL